MTDGIWTESIETTVDATTLLATALTEDRFRLLVDSVEEYAIFMLDPIGRILTWNTGAQRIKGYTSEEILGKHFSIFYIADDISADKPQRELADAVAHLQCRDQGWRVRKDGTRFWANVVITAIFDARGNVEGFAEVTRDETERKAADEYARELELLADRERIAADLHTAIVHRLVEASIAIEGTLQLVGDPIVAERIRGAMEILDDAFTQIRTAVFDLRS